jgi:diguanylate cyclase (GGDEF)-like protein
MNDQVTPNLPNFLLKSVIGVSLTAALALTPFTINNFIQGRLSLGLFTLALLSISIVNAWKCYKGQYDLKMNIFVIAPMILITVPTAAFQLGVAGSYWSFLGLVAFYFILPEKYAWLANTLFIAIISPIAWFTLEPDVMARFLAVLLALSFFIYLSTREINKQHELLQGQAITDPLSGLYNRTLLQDTIEKIVHQNSRTPAAASLLMIDIDHFKRINDDFGHDVGDRVIKDFGAFLKEQFRMTDMVFRIGGEEFLAILYNTDKLNSMKVAEKLRAEIEKSPLISNRVVTVSVGVAELRPDMTWQQWMKHVDDNLYKAKANGRNQVVG